MTIMGYSAIRLAAPARTRSGEATAGPCVAWGRGMSGRWMAGWTTALIIFPMSVAVIFLGGLTLVSLALFVLGIYLGLGPGGMERMIVYPVILWGRALEDI